MFTIGHYLLDIFKSNTRLPVQMKQVYIFFVLVSLSAVCLSQSDSFSVQGNAEDLTWNLFSLLVNIGGAMGACLPMAAVTGMGKPICALTGVATFSTFSCLLLRIYDGVITSDGLSSEVKKFIKNIGMKVEDSGELSSTDEVEHDSTWATWEHSNVAEALRQLQLNVDLNIGKVANSQGLVRTNYCFTFQMGSGTTNHPLAPFRQEICLTKFAARKLGNNRFSNMPAKILFKSLESLRAVGWKQSLSETRKFTQNIYLVFENYTQEFIDKLVNMVELISEGDEAQHQFSFVISDTFDGVLEQMIFVKLVRI